MCHFSPSIVPLQPPSVFPSRHFNDPSRAKWFSFPKRCTLAPFSCGFPWAYELATYFCPPLGTMVGRRVRLHLCRCQVPLSRPWWTQMSMFLFLLRRLLSLYRPQVLNLRGFWWAWPINTARMSVHLDELCNWDNHILQNGACQHCPTISWWPWEGEVIWRWFTSNVPCGNLFALLQLDLRGDVVFHDLIYIIVPRRRLNWRLLDLFLL